jgi:hypothetical protein
MLTRQKPSLLTRVAAFLRVRKKTVLLIAVVAGITLVVSGVVSIMLDGNSAIRLPSVGYIHAIGLKAYWDPALQNETNQVNWGTVYIGSSNNVSFYLQSTSNVPVILKMQYNWTLQNSTGAIVYEPDSTTFDYMNLNWTYNNQTLDRYQTIQVTLILSVKDSADFINTLIDTNAQQFTMNVTIQANEK